MIDAEGLGVPEMNDSESEKKDRSNLTTFAMFVIQYQHET